LFTHYVIDTYIYDVNDIITKEDKDDDVITQNDKDDEIITNEDTDCDIIKKEDKDDHTGDDATDDEPGKQVSKENNMKDVTIMRDRETAMGISNTNFFCQINFNLNTYECKNDLKRNSQFIFNTK